MLRLSAHLGSMRVSGFVYGLVDFIASSMGVDVLEGSDAAPLVFLELAWSSVFQKGSPWLCSLLVVEYRCVLGEMFRFAVWN